MEIKNHISAFFCFLPLLVATSDCRFSLPLLVTVLHGPITLWYTIVGFSEQ